MSQEFTEFLELFGCWGGIPKHAVDTLIFQWILFCIFVCLFSVQIFVVVSSLYYGADCGEERKCAGFLCLASPPPQTQE